MGGYLAFEYVFINFAIPNLMIILICLLETSIEFFVFCDIGKKIDECHIHVYEYFDVLLNYNETKVINTHLT